MSGTRRESYPQQLKPRMHVIAERAAAYGPHLTADATLMSVYPRHFTSAPSSSTILRVVCSFGAALSGFYCPANSSVRTLTPPGYFNNGFLPSTPSPCRPGAYCPADPVTGRYRSFLPCPAGTFSAGLQTNCTVCPAGTYCTPTE